MLSFLEEGDVLNNELLHEVEERLSLLYRQIDTVQAYLLERVREEDWSSVITASSQLLSISQELESVSAIYDKLQESQYE